MAVYAFALACVLRDKVGRANRVLELCDRLEVFRVDTAPLSTLVVDLQTIRDLANESFVRGAMGKSMVPPGVEAPVPTGIGMA
jgi:hypothetical protein